MGNAIKQLHSDLLRPINKTGREGLRGATAYGNRRYLENQPPAGLAGLLICEDSI